MIEVINLRSKEKRVIPFRSYNRNMLYALINMLDDNHSEYKYIRINGSEVDTDGIALYGIRVGTDNTPVSYDHLTINKANFDVGSLTVSRSGRIITIEQELTNNTGNNVDIIETAMVYSSNEIALSRDLLGSSLTVNSGDTVKITYQLDMSFLTRDNIYDLWYETMRGEFNYGFSKCIRKYLSNNVYVVNIYGSNRDPQYTWNYVMRAHAENPRILSDTLKNRLSIIMGKGNSAVSGSQNDLESPIIGSDVAYGKTIFYDGIKQDGNYHYFEFHRTAENVGSNTYTVQEIGLFIGGAYEQNDINNVYMFERQVLATPFSFAPGDYITLYYRMGIEV